MTRRFIALLASTCLATTAGAPMAFAQDTSEPGEDEDKIVVTGTLIRGIAPVGMETISVSEQLIEESGARTVNDVLATVPQFTNLFNRTVVGVPNQTRQILQPQIHGLDTLVLLDGRRMASAGLGFGGGATSIDPSMIPVGVLAGIEVVPDGGSALYGSDAVGGVVNMTTKKSFDGIEIDGTVTLGKAYTAFTANGTAGKAWDTGSAYVSYAYNQTNKVLGFDRPFITRTPPNTSCYPATVITRATTGAGALPAVSYSYTGVGPDGRPTAYTVGAASCNRHTYESIIPDEKMHSLFAGFRQEIGSSLRLDLRALWSQRKSVSYSAVALNVETGTGTTVPTTNPFYTRTPAELLNPARTQGVNLTLAPGAGNNLANRVKLETWGLSGELAADVFGDFQVRLLGNYNESDFNSVTRSSTDTTLLAQALARTGADALNPYNPGSTPGSILVSQQIVDRPQTERGLNKQTQIRLVGDGTLFSMPGGDVKIAVGGEYLHENFASDQEVRNFQGVIQGAPQSIRGRRTIYSAFGELDVPLISPESGGPIHSLRLNAAGRYDHYSDFGNTFNPRFAATLQPVEWVTLRGTYGHSFLAPALPQLFAAQTINYANNPFVLPPGATSVLLVLGGNPNLKPQKAETWTLGLDLKVPSVDGLRVNLTYYNVHYKERIGQAGGGPIQFQGGNFYSPQFANFFIKDPTYAQAVAFISSTLSPVPVNGIPGGGNLDTLYGPAPDRARIAASPSYVSSGQAGNIGIQNEQGLDFDVSYKHPTSFGSLDFRIGANYVLKKEVAQDGVNFVDSLLTETRFRGSFSAGADIGNFRLTGSVLHTGGKGLATNSTGQSRVESYTTVNTFFSYTFDESGILADTVLSLQVNNLFDARPPVNLTQGTGYDVGDLIGRSFQLGLKKKF